MSGPCSPTGGPRRSRPGQALLGGSPGACFPALGVARDGQRLPVQIELAPRHDADGRVVGTTATVRRGSFGGPGPDGWPGEGSPVPQARVDLQGRVLRVNTALAALLGEPAEDVVGRDGLSMYVGHDRAALAEALHRMAAGTEHYVREERTLRRVDGTPVEVVVTATLHTEADGRRVVVASLEQIDALRSAEREVRLQAERFRLLLETLPVAFFTYGHDGVCTSSRGSALARLGLVDDEMVGTPLFERYASPGAVEAMRAALGGADVPVSAEFGSRSWETRYRPLRDDDGEVVGGLGVSVDVTERTAAEREVRANEARLAALLRHSSEVVLVVDRQGRLLYVSPAVTAHFGYDDRALFWQDARLFDHPDDGPLLTAAARRVLRAPGTAERFESRVRHADGSWRWTEHVMTNLLDDPDVGGIVVHLRDLSEQRRTELELQRRSLHDDLTGLPGRALLLDRVAQALAWRRRPEDAVGLVLLDVAGLAGLNEALGLEGGDEVLRVVADRLLEGARTGDSVARLAGGTFAVLVQELASVEDLRARAATLADAVAGPVRVRGTSVQVGLSRGTATTPAVDAGALLSAAEQALRSLPRGR